MKIPFRLTLLLLSSLVSAGAQAHSGAVRPIRAEQPSQAAPQSSPVPAVVSVPGPLRSFLRMAAISQQAPADEVVPTLARNVVVNGYRGSHEKANDPTEFLVLLRRYLGQARELQKLAGPQPTDVRTGKISIIPPPWWRR